MVGVVLGLLVAACSGSDDPTADVEDPPASEIDLSSVDPELEELDLGVADRRHMAAVALPDDRLFLFGGLSLVGDGVRVHADGVVYDVDEGTAGEVPPWPYDAPYDASALVVGSDVYVIGYPCPGLLPAADDEVDCRSSKLEAALFDGEEWSELRSPSEDLDLPSHANTTRAFGISEGVALFAIRGGEPEIIGLDLATGAWSELGEIALDESSLCFDGAHLLRLDMAEDGMLESERLQVRSGEWVHDDGFDIGQPADFASWVACGPDAWAIATSEADHAWTMAMLAPSGWEVVAKPFERPEFSLGVLQLPGGVLMWPGYEELGPQLLVDDAPAWERLDVDWPGGNTPRLVQLGSAVAVVFDGEGTDPSTYHLLEL